MSINQFLLILCLAIPLCGVSQPDSAKIESKSSLTITPRFNSSGYFPYTGSFLNKNPNLDLNVFYNRKRYGFFVFKSIEIGDSRSYVNYLQPGVFLNFNLAPTLRFRSVVGYIFSQTAGFKDEYSDYFAALVTYWDLSQVVQIENTVLVFDLTLGEKFANRLKVTVSLPKKILLDVYVWERVVPGEKQGSTSASLGLTFPKVQLSKNWTIQNSFAYMGYLTQRKPDFSMRDGFVFTISLPITNER